MESALSKELACSGALDEISNAEQGEAIARYVGALERNGSTFRAVFFVVYQTGSEGPQNGFRLALVKEAATKEAAREQLKGVIEQGAAEFVIVRP